MNHSCDPNAFLELIRLGDHEIVTISPLKPIAKEEEIINFYCYNTKVDEVPLECKCASTKCSGYV